MESWMISGSIGLITFITTFVTIKNKQDTMDKKQNSMEEVLERIFVRLDQHGDSLVKLNTQSELSVTAKDVDDKYVSKELFRQFEKHIDSRFDKIDKRFDGVESGLSSILHKLGGNKCGQV